VSATSVHIAPLRVKGRPPEFGTISTGKWKAFCVCNPTNDVGVLESYNGIPQLGVTCTVPTFTASGDYSIGVACYHWSPLTK
jgi:hypothetical protein